MGKRHKESVVIATPAWADSDKIKSVYKMAKKLTKITGNKHEVDHIIPLNHSLVCGLHVENNLQVVPKEVNREKGNFFYPHNITKGTVFWKCCPR